MHRVTCDFGGGKMKRKLVYSIQHVWQLQLEVSQVLKSVTHIRHKPKTAGKLFWEEKQEMFNSAKRATPGYQKAWRPIRHRLQSTRGMYGTLISFKAQNGQAFSNDGDELGA